MCEKDFKFLYHYAYIAMEENIKLFKYLSDELIINPYILLYSFNNQECIYFYGANDRQYESSYCSSWNLFKKP